MQASEAAMDEGIRELTADAIVQAGGWHPRYARVLLIEHDRWLGSPGRT